uniref:ORF30 n=1 Tax=Nitrosopumilaceae spindle-shaped virus TaxID=3065433 RepID=A0AAT9J9C4_9VIRU
MKITKHSSTFVITALTYAKMKRNSATFPNCYYCIIKLEIGDLIHSKPGESKRHYYHKKCAEMVHLI